MKVVSSIIKKSKLDNSTKINKDQLLDFMVSEETHFTDLDKLEGFYIDTINKNKTTFNSLNDEIITKTNKINKLTMQLNKVSHIFIYNT